MTGWRRLITATVRLAHREGTRLRRRPADGRLLFEPLGETTSRSAERVRGTVTGAWALSAEICQACGDPGDPVTLGRGGRGTRCGECREPGDRVLPRPAWRRERETGHEAPGLHHLYLLCGLEVRAVSHSAKRRAGALDDGKKAGARTPWHQRRCIN